MNAAETEMHTALQRELARVRTDLHICEDKLFAERETYKKITNDLESRIVSEQERILAWIDKLGDADYGDSDADIASVLEDLRKHILSGVAP